MFITAATLLHYVLRVLTPFSQKRVSQSCIAIFGLNFNHNAINVRKTCLYQLDRYLSNRSDIVIRHDAVNNSISRHRENVTALIPNQLNKILLENKHIFHAVAYCKRLVTKDIYIKLIESGIQNISIVTFPISRRKQNLTEIWRKHSQLHQDPSLVMKTFTILRRFGNDIKYSNSMEKNSNPGKCKRQARRNRKLLSKNYEYR